METPRFRNALSRAQLCPSANLCIELLHRENEMASVRCGSQNTGPWRALQGDLLYMIFFGIATSFNDKEHCKNALRIKVSSHSTCKIFLTRISSPRMLSSK
jgi:hypothetical protein